LVMFSRVIIGDFQMLQSVAGKRQQNEQRAGGQNPKLEPPIGEDGVNGEHGESSPGQKGHVQRIDSLAPDRTIVDTGTILQSYLLFYYV